MARTVFPCFDEPAMKARFNVTIIHRRDTRALSNEERAGNHLNLRVQLLADNNGFK